MREYIYSGPVMSFDICIERKWVAKTTAVSPARARANLAYRYKKEHGFVSNFKITLPGKVQLV